jgi:hypothetical protein
MTVGQLIDFKEETKKQAKPDNPQSVFRTEYTEKNVQNSKFKLKH